MARLIDIDDEHFWDILFDEACVEGQQATRIRNELEKIIAYDVEKVVAELENSGYEADMLGAKAEYVNLGRAIEIVRNGGKE